MASLVLKLFFSAIAGAMVLGLIGGLVLGLAWIGNNHSTVLWAIVFVAGCMGIGWPIVKTLWARRP